MSENFLGNSNIFQLIKQSTYHHKWWAPNPASPTFHSGPALWQRGQWTGLGGSNSGFRKVLPTANGKNRQVKVCGINKIPLSASKFPNLNNLCLTLKWEWNIEKSLCITLKHCKNLSFGNLQLLLKMCALKGITTGELNQTFMCEI